MEQQFCKPARRGSRAWNACQNNPCQCDLLYKQSGEQVRDAAPEMLEALKDALPRIRALINNDDGSVPSRYESRKETLALMEKAIAKAEGRAQ